MYNLALRTVGNEEDAADMTQEVFLRAYRALGTFRGESKFSVWLYRLTTNVCIDFKVPPAAPDRVAHRLRGRRRAAAVRPPRRRERRPGTAADPQRNAPLRRARARTGLPDDARKILILRELDGLSYAEIGKVLHLEAGTVKSRLFRARRRLCDFLLADGNLPDRYASSRRRRCRRMSACEHYQQQISQLLDGELPPEQVQTLRAHLRTCPECQRVYDDFLALQAAVRDAAAAPPADLTARIMQQVRQEPVPMPPRSAAPARPARHVQLTPIRRAAQPRPAARKRPGRQPYVSPAADLGHGGVSRADPRCNALVRAAQKPAERR